MMMIVNGKHHSNVPVSLQHGLPGPPGPPGPRGPPGPPTPLLPQQQELIQELQLKLRGQNFELVHSSLCAQLDSGRSLQRGRGFNSSSGRYTAPISGFYHKNHNLCVSISICIESLCQSNLILLTGTLYLQAGEYVSVFVDNATGSMVNVLPHSLFSGLLLGV
uniref:C1q domain-containing protein n=1 Tax=Echeneis naucrates TaxID=173247 RepID=A0A665V578_ECHNA